MKFNEYLINENIIQSIIKKIDKSIESALDFFKGLDDEDRKYIKKNLIKKTFIIF